MTYEEQRVWLIRQLLAERPEYKNTSVPEDGRAQRDLLRALMNVRPPAPVSDEFLLVQDQYLSKLVEDEGIVDAASLPEIPGKPGISLWQGDITRLRIGAIVNPANSGLTGCYRPLHNCLDNVIHSKAGIQLRLECDRIMREQGHEEPTGQAKITPAYNLPCDHVIHTVGPIVQGSLTKHHEEQLASCYRSCLEIAEKNDIKSIAFCCISTGVFMFPNQRAAEIAVATIRDWMQEHDGIEKVVFNVFKDIDLEIYDKLLNQ